MKINPEAAQKARYIMIGGFLGAGKTTAVGQLAKRLTAKGLRVGLITNDQGRDLVDTTMLRAQGFATEEIPGGCFCCRFNSLLEASQRLKNQVHPDVFIAEPVGSCTDLAATVTYPLRRMYGDNFTVAPVSVMVDPVRALRVFGLEPGGNFSSKVVYIYKKQIEEANLVVINKSDAVAPERLRLLSKAIEETYPGKQSIIVSARQETNLDGWFERLTNDRQAAGTAMDVDYQLYAEGEALLGWLNCTVRVTAHTAFDSEAVLKRLATDIQAQLQGSHAETAHLKMTLSPDSSFDGAIASISLVRNDFVPELTFHLKEPVKSGQLIINCRAEADPDLMETIVRRSLRAIESEFPTLGAALEHLEHFRPGKPVPTHRVTRVDD